MQLCQIDVPRCITFNFGAILQFTPPVVFCQWEASEVSESVEVTAPLIGENLTLASAIRWLPAAQSTDWFKSLSYNLNSYIQIEIVLNIYLSYFIIYYF